MYVRNAWYCVGWSADFGETPVTRRVMEEDIVLFRASDGRLAALEDLCPHRFLPLSKGRRTGDAIECGYHGMTFGADGRCVRIPGQATIPENARVRHHAVEERHGVVWLFMGDPAAADPARIFDLYAFTDPAWTLHHGEALEIAANYLNVAENLVDPAHVSFVHPTTLGSAAGEDVPVETRKDGETIVTWRWIRNAPPVGFFRAFGGFPGNVDRWHYYHMHAPNVAAIDFGSAAVEDGIGEDERDRGVRLWALHFLTPVDRHTTVDWWMHLRNTARDVAGIEERMDDLFRTAFAEDKEILEAIEERERKVAGRRQLRIAIDRGPSLYRRQVADLIAAEGGTMAAAAE